MVANNQSSPAPIIPLSTTTLADETVQTVNARDLHQYLEVGRDFSNWIKGRISSYGFEEGRDYLLAKTGEQLPSGTKYRNDYHLTLDMAKELAMVERTAKGREARRYFIDCERALHQGGTTLNHLGASAYHLATEHQRDCDRVASAAGVTLPRIPAGEAEQLAAGLLLHAMQALRFIATIDQSGQPHLKPIPADALVTTHAQIPDLIDQPAFPPALLPKVAKVCIERMDRLSHTPSAKR